MIRKLIRKFLIPRDLVQSPIHLHQLYRQFVLTSNFLFILKKVLTVNMNWQYNRC